AAVALDLHHGHALQAEVGQRRANLLELERLDDGRHQLHVAPLLARPTCPRMGQVQPSLAARIQRRQNAESKRVPLAWWPTNSLIGKRNLIELKSWGNRKRL